ncbi:hypothetical protein [Sphingomonas sp. AP4-R1]|nr:hypothetical protein [Sphingomonas sp. AP4-R1]
MTGVGKFDQLGRVASLLKLIGCGVIRRQETASRGTLPAGRA